jgi:hypothetical protein
LQDKEMQMSRSFLRLLTPVAAALAASTMAAPASATETSFATVTGIGLSFVATNTDVNGSLALTDTSAVTFGFLATNLTSYISTIPANIVFNATSANTNYSSVLASFGVARQTNFTGALTITSTQAITIGKTTFAAGSNLLTANFTNATFLGVLGQQNAGLTADSKTGTLVYTSDFLTFDNTVSRDFSFSFGAITPTLSSGTDPFTPTYLQSFTSTPTGSFASDPAPLSLAVVPEPASWAMMMLGLGAIGMSLRAGTLRRPRTA